jgi:hypothetical protein
MESIIKWIHVTDALPPLSDLTAFEMSVPLLVVSDGEVVVCRFIRYYKDGKVFWENIGNQLFEYDVTHWAELPDPPA